MSLEILRISEPRLLPGHGIPLRHIEVAYRGQRVEPFELAADTFQQLDADSMVQLFTEYAEGLLQMFGPWSPDKRKSRGRR